MNHGRVVGVVVSVAVMLGWSVQAWADDDDDSGGGGGGDHAAPEPGDHGGDKPDQPDPPGDGDHAGAGDGDHAGSAAAGDGDGDHAGSATGDGDHAGSAAGDGDHAGSAAAGDDHAGDDHPAAAGDSDGDGTPDSAEDSDGDGTPDSAEDSDHDGTPDSVDTDDDNDGKPDTAEDSDGDGVADGADTDDDNDGILDSQEGEEGYDPDADNEGEPPYVEYDTDGDGVVEPEEAAFQADYGAAYGEIANDVSDDALDSRPNDKELLPSMTVDQFRKLVRLAKTKVLARLEEKIDRKQAKKMLQFTKIVCAISLAGIFLLLTPLFLRKKYPGQGKTLFKYAALAAGTWLVTVNLFGGVLFGMRTVQGALSGITNPQLALAAGLFDTLDDNAERYITTGKELFAPSLKAMQGNYDEQPAAILIENGMKIVQDAKVFKSMAGLFKKVDWLFAMLPIVLLLVTLILFVLAIKPTLIEIIKLPMRAAAGDAGAGRDVMRKSMRRVIGELKATLCTLGVLAVLTVLSGFVLGQIVGPALDGLLSYFSLAVTYLQFKTGASSGLVFIALFGVIFFLVLNLATLILSMGFFLGKTQKIFQQRFNDDVPLSRHRRFFKWGVPSVVFVQVFPLLFVFLANFGLSALNSKLTSGVTTADDINWTAIMLAGPLFLVFGYIVTFWAARGVKAIKFLFAYKPKLVLTQYQAELPRATSLPQ